MSGRRKQTLLMDTFTFIELLFHTIVREVRSESGSAMLGFLGAVGRVLVLVAIFYGLYEILGMRGSLVRGDVILFLISGVLLFFLHNSAIQKTIGAGSQTGPMMMHAPMTPALTMLASTLAQLYLYLLALFIILLGMYLLKGDLEIYRWEGLILPLFLAWSSGIVIGLLFLLVKPFAPKVVALIAPVYMRANMITSGKFFVANLLPASVLPFFQWNPLFHAIDQMRGEMFVNYFPRNSSLAYSIYFVMLGLVIGLMGEFWLRRTVSVSTGKR